MAGVSGFEPATDGFEVMSEMTLPPGDVIQRIGYINDNICHHMLLTHLVRLYHMINYEVCIAL